MRILALDVGEKNIGLAISDELAWTAQGLPTLRRSGQEDVYQHIAKLVTENNVSEVIVGMPINMDGSLGKKAREVVSFLEALQKTLGVPVKLWDERMSSLQAEKVLLEADLSRKKRKKKIDLLAAQIILQSYLDARSNPPEKADV